MNDYYGLIDERLLFNTYKEFCMIRKWVLEAYRVMSPKEIVIYRMYVYSRPFIHDKTKDRIWNEITGYGYMLD